MRKIKKNRVQSAQAPTSESIKPNELVKTLMRKTAGQLKTPIKAEGHFLKSFSTKVRDQRKPEQTTSKSFYSKHQNSSK